MSKVTAIRKTQELPDRLGDLDARLEALDAVVQVAFESIMAIPMSNPEFESVNKALVFLNVAEREIESIRALAQEST